MKRRKANPKEKTREQAEKMQAKAVRFLRDVVKDSDKADEIEGLSVAEYAERKKIALTNPKGRTQKRSTKDKVRRTKRNRKGKTYHIVEFDANDRATVLRTGLARADAKQRVDGLRKAYGSSGLRFIMQRDEVSNPKRRKNQGGNGAAKLYTAFHGKEPKEVLEFQQDIIRRKDYAALGKLIEMQLPEIRTAIDFAADDIILAANAEGTQLYLIGGNQNIDGLIPKVADDSKDFVNLGELKKVVYRTRKDFDRYEEIDYGHPMGEGGYERPVVMYDKLNHQLYVAGGEYKIKHEGITH